MIALPSTNLRFSAFYTNSGVAATGLTVDVDIWLGNTKIVSKGTAGEVGGGLYAYTLGSGSTAQLGSYIAIFQASGTVDQSDIASVWVVSSIIEDGVWNADLISHDGAGTFGGLVQDLPSDVADAVWDEATADHSVVGSFGEHLKALPASVWDYLTSAITTAGSIGKYLLEKLALIVSGSVTVSSPVNADGTCMEIVQGDDYYASEDRAIDWTSSDWPNLDSLGVSVVWSAINEQDSTDTATVAMTIVSAGVDEQTVRLELPASTTNDLAIGTARYKYDVEATLANGHKVTLVIGYMTVLEDVTA